MITQPTPTLNKIGEFEGLRALLAMWVVVYHVFVISGVLLPEFLNGSQAVSAFFILSGFVISMLIQNSTETYLSFVIRRFFRLFPVYAICILVSVFLVLNGIMPRKYDEGSTVTHLLLHAVMLHGIAPTAWLPGSDGAFLNPAWSISVEWQFYLVIPAFYALMRRHAVMAWILLLSIAAISHRYLLSALDLGGASLLAYFHYFVYGILSYYFYEWARTSDGKRAVFFTLLPICLPLLVSTVVAIAPNFGLMIWLAFFGASISVRSGSALKPTIVVVGLLRSRLLVWGGAISYGLYLCHEPIIWLCVRALELWYPDHNQATGTILVGMVSIPMSLLVAHFLHKHVEVPLIRIGKSLAEKYQPKIDVAQV